MPIASVVIPAYNARDFIATAYKSVASQTETDLEIIFVDDGSDDDTLAIVKSFSAADRRVKVIDLQANHGPAFARNIGIAEAKGDWIAFLDADDRFERDRIEALTKAGLQANADMVLDNQFIVDPISKAILCTAFPPAQPRWRQLTLSDFLHNTQSGTVFDFGYLKPVINRNWLTANKARYQEQLRLGEDLMFALDCYGLGATAVLVSEPYYYYNFPYSHWHRKASPTSRTEAGCEALLVAAEAYLRAIQSTPSSYECILMESTCEYLREIIAASDFRTALRGRSPRALLGTCFRQPIRLLRGIYFDRKRNTAFLRHAQNSHVAQEKVLSVDKAT